MPHSNAQRRIAESFDTESLEEAEFAGFINKLPVPTSINIMRATYACIANMNGHELLDTRVDCNI